MLTSLASSTCAKMVGTFKTILFLVSILSNLNMMSMHKMYRSHG